MATAMDLKENMGQFRRSNFSFAYERKLNKWLDMQLYYRYIANYEQDKNRFRIALSTDKKIYKKTTISIWCVWHPVLERVGLKSLIFSPYLN